MSEVPPGSKLVLRPEDDYHHLPDPVSHYNESMYFSYVKSLDFRTTADGVDYQIHGDVLSLIPLRNRRETPDGEMLVTRITEGMTAYTCNGAQALGMSEYLDQIVDGRPVGI